MTKFELGQVVVTRKASRTLGALDIEIALNRHAQGDWGVAPEQDRLMNDQALLTGGVLLSSYLSRNTLFWIVTDSDRLVTTVLLPEEF